MVDLNEDLEEQFYLATDPFKGNYVELLVAYERLQAKYDQLKITFIMILVFFVGGGTLLLINMYPNILGFLFYGGILSLNIYVIYRVFKMWRRKRTP